MEKTTKTNFENHVNGIKAQGVMNTKGTFASEFILQVPKSSKFLIEEPLKKPLKALEISTNDENTPLLESRCQKLVKKLDFM